MQTRAAVMAQRGGRWSVDNIEVADPGPGEVRVRVVASGICQSDVHARDGFYAHMPWPAVFGHEGAGVVESVSPGITTFAPQDHVIMAAPS
ncbi:MAG: aryl-alcohol dehydrogenase [Gammaproteobacteria bacterium]|jgi:aryl-alcohol dehydrogenase